MGTEFRLFGDDDRIDMHDVELAFGEQFADVLDGFFLSVVIVLRKFQRWGEGRA